MLALLEQQYARKMLLLYFIPGIGRKTVARCSYLLRASHRSIITDS